MQHTASSLPEGIRRKHYRPAMDRPERTAHPGSVDPTPFQQKKKRQGCYPTPSRLKSCVAFLQSRRGTEPVPPPQYREWGPGPGAGIEGKQWGKQPRAGKRPFVPLMGSWHGDSVLFGGNAPLARLVFSPAGKIISRHGVLVFYIDVPMCSLGPAAPFLSAGSVTDVLVRMTRG